ncbi:MAG: molybdopterin molybdotransferase MoeA [Deltaproteobacteria bacterium]|jgi:molybdopterin molybdotransferase|nr:molybdopterin molybdotransferase MoeA [Deltaproteobacteria bacterium]
MKEFIGYKEALELTLAHVVAGETEMLPLDSLVGRILAGDVVGRVDCPSIGTSRKDGYAVVAADLSRADAQNPVRLNVLDSLSAGDRRELAINSGQTVRVTTGAPLPAGADAVLSEEFCRRKSDAIEAFNTAETGRNIHQRGKDIRQGDIIAAKGVKLNPALIGLIAAAGLDAADVIKYPKVAVIATGDEVVAPGRSLRRGQLYASNMVEIGAWLSGLSLPYLTELVADQKEDIKNAIEKHLPGVDVFLTSGGAWGSERDLILDVVADFNWQGIYHRVRMGPGKPVGFGLLNDKPFFCLPGGPPSNEMAFMQLALPALLKMIGEPPVAFPMTSANLAQTVYGKKDWTDFVHARLEKRQGQLFVHPARLKSALLSMAQKEALIIIPEDREEIAAGELIDIQLLSSNFFPYLPLKGASL